MKQMSSIGLFIELMDQPKDHPPLRGNSKDLFKFNEFIVSF